MISFTIRYDARNRRDAIPGASLFCVVLLSLLFALLMQRDELPHVVIHLLTSRLPLSCF